MTIKELQDYIQKFKKIRNEYENLACDLNTRRDREQSEARNEAENRDRAGFGCNHGEPDLFESFGWESAVSKFEYSVGNMNEGLSFLETAYRQSVRYREEKVDKNEPKKEKES